MIFINYMKIQNSSYSLETKNKIAFSANIRKVANKITRSTLYKNNSWYFRSDLNWNKLIEKLDEKYSKVDKVNVYCFACSEGAEPFSLAMMLIEKLGFEKAQKFFPIIASDIDTEILIEPKKGIINVSEGDLENIKENIGNNYLKYMNLEDDCNFSHKLYQDVYKGEISSVIRNAVIFKNYDMKSRIFDVPKRNSVVMCRNFWPYLEKPFQDNNKAQLKLLDNACNKLGDNSLIIIGEYDNYSIGNKLIERGFYKSDVPWMYTKDFDKGRFKDEFFLGNEYYLKQGSYKVKQEVVLPD